MNDVASSELTMLFTDIEGSTRLLNRLGASATPTCSPPTGGSCAAASRARGGREMGTEGDSFFVVFGSAADAVAAAAEGQRGLEAGPWPDGVRLRVRMGLHTGHPEPFEDNLVGLDVHLAARVSATAHGGQVVLSSATAQQVAEALPPGTSLLDLGVHRLKDITEPQRLCQLRRARDAGGVPAAAQPRRPGQPALRTDTRSSAGRTSWRRSPRCCRPGDGGCVTLTGPGGAGKTRLSLAVAEALAPAFPDGVHFVDLAPRRSTSMAWTTLAETLGRSGERTGRPPRPPRGTAACCSCSTTSSSCRTPVRRWCERAAGRDRAA